MSETDEELSQYEEHSSEQSQYLELPKDQKSRSRQTSLLDPLPLHNNFKQQQPVEKEEREKKFVEMIMKEQRKLERLRRKQQYLALLPPKATFKVEMEPAQIQENGYIDHKVDFNENLSEDFSNSWFDEISCQSDSEEIEPVILLDLGTQTESSVEPQMTVEQKDDIISNCFEQSDQTKTTSEAEVKIEELKQKDTVIEIKVEQGKTETLKIKKQRLVINVAQTEYDVIKKVAMKECNWRLKYFYEDQDGALLNNVGGNKLSPDFDLTWHDLCVTPDFVKKLHAWQKVNMFPGIQQLTKKNFLARNLMRMQKQFPCEYDFFPKTWVLPYEGMDLRNNWIQTNNNRRRRKVTYIVKPDGLSQGQGIFLSQNVDQIFEKTMNIQKADENDELVIKKHERCEYIIDHQIK